AASSSNASSSSGAPSSSSSSSGGPTHCGGMDVLADDFPGSDPGEVWTSYNWAGATVSQAGGEVVVVLPNANPNGAGAVFQTRRWYDLRKDSVSIEVTNATNPSTTAQAYFWVGIDDQNYVDIYQKNGTLNLVDSVAGSFSSLMTLPYDPI